MANSLPVWIELIFGVRLAQYPDFKNRLNSYVRNGAIESSLIKEEHIKDGRGKRLIRPDQKTVIHNIVILDAFFGNVGFVKLIINNPSARSRASDVLKLLFLNCNAVLDLPLSSPNLGAMLKILDDTCSLKTNLLPSPFLSHKLPQTQLPDISSLTDITLAKASVTSIASDFIHPYLEGNIALAYKLLPEKSSSQPLQLLTDIIKSEYHALVEFEETLTLFE